MRTYYELIKPGIVYGNAMTALAAFVFASHTNVNIPLLLEMLLGLSCAIASACVINNIIDRNIDTEMERTKNRVIPTGQISITLVFVFAAILFVLGFGILYFFTNVYAVLITLLGVVIYLGLYTPAKRSTKYSTLIGAASGAVPIVVGYVTATQVLDSIALLLFLILLTWQMAHFFAIAIFRKDEYANAALPVMPVSIGIERTKILILSYAILFAGSVGTLAFVAQLGLLFTIPMGIVCSGWIALGISGWHKQIPARLWARRMFFYSIAVLILFSVLLALSPIGG